MRFLDPKEEVYKVKITPWGKYLLSQGKFDPTYYAFFDDDIVYDSSFLEGTGDSPEEQNRIQERILDETPRFEGQTSFQGSEATVFTKFPNLLDEMFPGVSEKLDDPSYKINSFDKPLNNYYLQKPLGRSGNNSSEAPFYSLKSLKGNILTASLDGSGSSGYFANKTENPTSFISQVEFELQNEITINTTPNPTITPTNIIENDELFDSFYVFEDFTTMQYDKKDLLIKLEEGNTQFLKENFQIEVFEIITTTGSTGEIKEDLKKLNFAREDETVSKNHVEYYFNIFVDNDINPETYCKAVANNKTKDIFSDNTFKCPDINQEKVNLNIYNTDDIISPPDKC